MNNSTDVQQLEGAHAVTPHDTNLLAKQCRSLFVGGAGNIALTTRNEENVTLTGVLAGSIIPLSCIRVKSTGTTATNIVAMY